MVITILFNKHRRREIIEGLRIKIKYIEGL